MKHKCLFQVFTTVFVLVSCFSFFDTPYTIRGASPISASGMAMSQRQTSGRKLIAAGDLWRYYKGTSEPPENWTQLSFDDSTWSSGATGIGYGAIYSQYNRTVLSDMLNNYRAVYLRQNFIITNPGAVAHIWLQIHYDDGFIAYLNGHEVVRRNMGLTHTPAPYTMEAIGYHNADKPEIIELTDCLTILEEGTNVLSVQVHNTSISNSNLSITPELLIEEQPGDLADVVLLKAPNSSQEMDNNFRLLAGYYGLKYAVYDLFDHQLSPHDLLDGSGEYYSLIIASEAALNALDIEELSVLRTTLQIQMVTLLIYDLSSTSSPAVEFLTNGEVIGSTQPVDSHLDWEIGNGLPEITREFSGQTLDELEIYDQVDYALIFGVMGQSKESTVPAHIIPLIQATDDTGQVYTIFAAYQAEAGRILLQGRNARLMMGNEPVYVPMRKVYTARYLSEIVPLMMALRSTAGEEAWHCNQDTANFTIDDPYLRCDNPSGDCNWEYLNWQTLLNEMQIHNFHTTIAMIPRYYQNYSQGVVTLFQQNPKYYSLAMHGNNHDNGLLPPDNCPEFSPLYPLDEQETAIKEAIWKMRQNQFLFGLPYGRVMVFPCGGSALVTFDLLKKYNFSMTVNAQGKPMDSLFVDTWDRGMGLAELAYNNFPNLSRANTNNYPLDAYTYIFDLFRDQPVMIYSHASYDLPSILAAGSNGFNPYADAINSLAGDVNWQSLDGIAKSLYQEKKDDTDKVVVRMYSNHIQLENTESHLQLYQLRREENFAYSPHVLVDGVEMPYQIRNGQIIVQLSIPAYSSRDVLIAYNTGIILSPSAIRLTLLEGTVSEYRVSLVSQPENNVKVMIDYDGPIIASPKMLEFTPENWNLPQVVQVSVLNDGITEPLFMNGMINHVLISDDPFFQGIRKQIDVVINFQKHLPIFQ